MNSKHKEKTIVQPAREIAKDSALLIDTRRTCEICNKTLMNESNLKKHMDRVHSEEVQETTAPGSDVTTPRLKCKLQIYHMEYSMWSLFHTTWCTPYGRFFGAIWSALGFITEVKIYCHMEYSIWLFYDAIWSTPYGRNLRPHGVLHNVVKNVYC